MSDVSLREPFRVIGLQVRTSNEEEAKEGRIGALWQRFYAEGVSARIPQPLRPGEVIAVYSGYASDETGPFDLLVGAAVPAGTPAPAGLTAQDVPGGRYLAILSPRGPIPGSVIDAWKQAWSQKSRRAFASDYEVYDQRARDMQSAQIELFVSVK